MGVTLLGTGACSGNGYVPEGSGGAGPLCLRHPVSLPSFLGSCVGWPVANFSETDNNRGSTWMHKSKSHVDNHNKREGFCGKSIP
ncbi:hypothetical protein ES703_120036 [subsurface metagenome]